MIVGDRNMMKAALTRGVLQIQLNLIELYTSNLNSIATQAALISSFEFTGIAETVYPTNQTSNVPLQNVLAYFYYSFITFGIVCGLFAVSQATIVTIYGPGTALSGETPEAMTTAVSNMRKQQDFVFKLCGVSVTCLFISCICMEWARRPMVRLLPPSFLPLFSALFSASFCPGSLCSRDTCLHHCLLFYGHRRKEIIPFLFIYQRRCWEL
jgi:hypothetical protein